LIQETSLSKGNLKCGYRSLLKFTEQYESLKEKKLL
jgi:hypothetical protein